MDPNPRFCPQPAPSHWRWSVAGFGPRSPGSGHPADGRFPPSWAALDPHAFILGLLSARHWARRRALLVGDPGVELTTQDLWSVGGDTKKQ